MVLVVWAIGVAPNDVHWKGCLEVAYFVVLSDRDDWVRFASTTVVSSDENDACKMHVCMPICGIPRGSRAPLG